MSNHVIRYRHRDIINAIMNEKLEPTTESAAETECVGVRVPDEFGEDCASAGLCPNGYFLGKGL